TRPDLLGEEQLILAQALWLGRIDELVGGSRLAILEETRHLDEGPVVAQVARISHEVRLLERGRHVEAGARRDEIERLEKPARLFDRLRVSSQEGLAID